MRLRALVGGQGIALLCGQSYLIALSAAVVPVHGVGTFSLLYAADLATRALLLATAGFLLGTMSERRVLVGSDLTRALGLASLALATQAGPAALALGCVLVAAGSSSPASIVPAQVIALAPSDEPRRVLAVWRGVAAVARIVSPAVGAVAMLVTGSTMVFWTLAVVCCAVAVIDVLAAAPTRPTRRGILTEAGAGYRHVKNSRPLMLLFTVDLAHIVIPVSLWMLLVQSPERLGLREGGQGWVLSCFGAGALLGVLIGRWWGPRRPLAAAVVAGSCIALPLGAAAQAPHVVVLLVMALIAGAATELGSLWTQSFIASTTPHDLVSRVLAVNMLVTLGAMPLGLVIAGRLLESVGTERAVYVALVALATTSLAALPALWRSETVAESSGLPPHSCSNSPAHSSTQM